MKVRMMRNKKRVSARHITLILLMASLFPAGVLAAWTSPGQDFNGELTLDGQVTSVRNPWVWQLGKSHAGLSVKADILEVRNEGLVWQGLMSARPLLLGKTVLTTPAGREGLAPVVSFGGGLTDFSLTHEGEGLMQVILPVYSTDVADKAAGSLQFRIETAMLLLHVENGTARYAGLYSDQSGNALAGRGNEMSSARTASELCEMFAGEGPDWLCSPPLSVQETGALSLFTNGSLRQVEGVFGAQVIAGSGVLRMHTESVPASWKATLSVRIEYR